MADFEHLIAGIRGLIAVTRNNQAKADGDLKEIGDEMLAKMETK
jgi:hypothetical protein